MAGAPIGNTNARRGKDSTRALERALEIRSGKAPEDAPMIERFAILVEAWDKQITAAVDASDLAALNAMTDRLDGKPMQSTEMSGPDGGSIYIAAVEYQDGAKDPRQVPE